MPLYFVDLDDGRAETRDAVGAGASSPEAARDQAVRLLTEVAKAAVDGSSEQLLIATVRDGADRHIYRIVLALTCSRPKHGVA